MREVFERVLERLGITVWSTGDPAEAEAICDDIDGQLDLVITDLILPGVKGTELIRRLRRSHPDLKVLLTSGYSDLDEIGDITADPNQRFLTKPFQVDELLSTVRGILGSDSIRTVSSTEGSSS